MEENPIAVHVANLTKRYTRSSGTAPALSDISFDIPVGKIWCLLGPNGSGKTTLLKILAGLLTATEGTLSLLGTDPVKDPPAARAKVGWMPSEERSGFYGRLTPRQNLQFFGALQGL